MIRFSNISDYGFAIGRVRARESKLLKRSDFEKIIDADSEDGLLSLVKERDQADVSEKEFPSKTKMIEYLLKQNLEENHKFFAQYCHEPLVKELFLKTPIKQTQRIIAILYALDNEFLNQYFITTFDLENIRNFVRIKYFAEKEKQDTKNQSITYTNIYLRGGGIPLQVFLGLFDENWDGILRWINSIKYQDAIEDGVNYLLNKNSFRRLERRIEEKKQKVLYLSRFATFGYEPLVGYYLVRDTELKNLKQIFYGILSNTPKELMRESVAWIL
ncbi:MAG: V-type ATPase subunit [candidate division WOR-3 bacterium]|nr:V-type ATPase subunit [candidate division WOR-3 bacterium]